MRPRTRARFRHTLPRVRSLAGPRTGSAWCLFQPRALAFPTGLVRGLKAYGMTLMVAAPATPAAVVPYHSYVKGWKISPSHYLNQDLSTVWLDK